MDKKKQEEYHFVKEHIKKIPPDRKKRRMSLGWTILLAAVFGVVAALVFCAVKPAIERLFQSKNEQVVLSSDETKEADTADEPVYITETQQMDLNDYQICKINCMRWDGKRTNPWCPSKASDRRRIGLTRSM